MAVKKFYSHVKQCRAKKLKAPKNVYHPNVIACQNYFHHKPFTKFDTLNDTMFPDAKVKDFVEK